MLCWGFGGWTLIPPQCSDQSAVPPTGTGLGVQSELYVLPHSAQRGDGSSREIKHKGRVLAARAGPGILLLCLQKLKKMSNISLSTKTKH